MIAGADEDGAGAGAERTVLTPDGTPPPASTPLAKPPLGEAPGSEPAIEGKWPRVATVTFIVVVCGLFWLAVALAVRLLLR